MQKTPADDLLDIGKSVNNVIASYETAGNLEIQLVCRNLLSRCQYGIEKMTTDEEMLSVYSDALRMQWIKSYEMYANTITELLSHRENQEEIRRHSKTQMDIHRMLQIQKNLKEVMDD